MNLSSPGLQRQAGTCSWTSGCMECFSRNWNWFGFSLRPRVARMPETSVMAEWPICSELKRSHTASLSSPSMASKFSRAASLFRAQLPVMMFSVETLGSGHFSLSSTSFAVTILGILQLVSSINCSTSVLLASLK